MKFLPDPEDVIRVECLDPPRTRDKREGLYQWRHLGSKFLLDVLDVLKELESVMPGRSEAILDRLQNFRVVYLNTKTGEVST